MYQSELEVNTCNQREARENVCEQVVIGLSFTFDWSRKWRYTLNQSQSKVKQNQSKRRITFDSQLKSALSYQYQLLFSTSNIYTSYL